MLSNADPSRADQNEHSHATPAEVLQAFKERLPNKRRKDAVLGIEYFVSASPEWFKGRDRAFVDGYFAQSLAWLRERHGEENVVGWSIHCDESSPHLVAYVVPRDGDTLNAKKWLGGRAALSRMQSDFAEKVARHHELERGIEGSRAHHQSIKDFYAQIEKPGQHVIISPETVQPKVLKKGFLTSEYETPEMVAERLTASVQKAYTPAVEAAKLAASESRRADEMTLTAQTLSREKKEAQERLPAARRTLCSQCQTTAGTPCTKTWHCSAGWQESALPTRRQRKSYRSNRGRKHVRVNRVVHRPGGYARPVRPAAYG